jgi:acyl-CoA synthetase (AMP-forming)/AMP-acid ligase II
VHRGEEGVTLELQRKTVVESLYFEAKLSGPSRHVTFVDDEGKEEQVSYVRTLEQAFARAGVLQRLGVAPREPVPVLVPTSPDFLYLFFALQLTGAVPAPLAPPASFGDMDDFVRRTERIATYLGAKRVITVGPLQDVLREGLPGVQIVLAEHLRAEAERGKAAFDSVKVVAEDLAMIQCTSGSTGTPKGVMLTHENLIANVHQIGFMLGVREGDVTVCWLPLYHDMGLIGCLLFATYWNLDSVFLSPARFLRRPVSWLQAISRHKGTLSPAPNFAYSYVTSRTKDEELVGLDLSSWRIALCGAEPVDPRTLHRFEERFKHQGLRAPISVPCYGLAEATLAVTIHPIGAPLLYDKVAREPLAAGEVRDTHESGAMLVTNCGPPMPETLVRILDDEGHELPEGRVGRVQVKGPTVMRGYYNLPDETARVLRDGWLDTGDLGYMRGGELRLTGRSKDLVIIRGRNYAPSDFEWAAEEVPGIRKGNVIALGIVDAEQGTETLHLVCETDVDAEDAREKLAQQVRAHVTSRTGVAPAAIELVARNTIPKTSSGKLQRSKMRERYLASLAFRGMAHS